MSRERTMTHAEDLVGHLGYVLLFGGILVLAEKHWAGFAMRMVGELIWGVLGWRMRSTSICGWCFVGLAIEARGLYRWL